MSEEPTIGELVGERIRHYRTKAGLTQRELSKLTGINRPNITRLELGRRGMSPRLDTVVRIANGLGIRTIDLLCVLDDIEELEITFDEEEE